MLHDYRKKYHDIKRAFPPFISHVKYLATRVLHYKLRPQISTVYHTQKENVRLIEKDETFSSPWCFCVFF